MSRRVDYPDGDYTILLSSIGRGGSDCSDCGHGTATRADETCPVCGAALTMDEWQRVGARAGWLTVPTSDWWDDE